MKYLYKTKPFDHQHEEFTKYGLKQVRGIFWEQGVGKSKPVIDTAAALYERKIIDAFVVVAPNGVHQNWLSDEIPQHMPGRVQETIKSHIWTSSKAGTQKHDIPFKQLFKHSGLSILVMSYNGIMTEKGRNALKKFFKVRSCLYVLDESHFIKNPGAKRTKRILASSSYAKYRRILTGTPIANNPFDIYSQLKFLDPTIWKQFGICDFAEFKVYFGIWETRTAEVKKKGELTKRKIEYPHCLSYKNIEQLNTVLHSMGSRLTKEDAGLNLPPKLYSKRYYELNPDQKRMYQELKDNYIAYLNEGDECKACNGTGLTSPTIGCTVCGGHGVVGVGVVEADLAIVRLLRFQQIICGYVPTGDENKMEPIGKTNPRFNVLKEILEGAAYSTIIWSRFVRDIDMVCDYLGDECVRYDGQVDSDERLENKKLFQSGEKKFFVGNPQVGSTGLTLTVARLMVYYTNSFNLNLRLQSEDRFHRIGQKYPVSIIDIIAQGTVDVRITGALRDKLDIASQITGDRLREWL